MGHYSTLGDVTWAQNEKKPQNFANHRPQGRKAEGLRYEREVVRAIPRAYGGLWFRFFDSRGEHWCQPDCIFGWGGILWVLEVKYSLVEEGFTQIEELYSPVLEAAYKRRVLGIQVCKVLRPHSDWQRKPRIASSLAAAMTLREAGAGRVVWHWPGGTTIGTHLPDSPQPVIDSGARVVQA